MWENRPCGSMSGEGKRSPGHRATPRLYIDVNNKKCHAELDRRLGTAYGETDYETARRSLEGTAS
jgi:hypothetical protein